tara:strand:- start:109 stop:429 length:321 start_codon:yes stop_codon:yes gene_type:complete
VEVLLHEDIDGGFSPPAAHKIRRLGHKSREHVCGVDRTSYKGDRKISFVSYHTRAISTCMNIVRAVAWTLHDAAQKLRAASAANLTRRQPRRARLINRAPERRPPI